MNTNTQDNNTRTYEYAVDDQTGKMYEVRKEGHLDRAAAMASVVYLLFMLALFCWQLFDIWLGYYYLARLVYYPVLGRLAASSFRLTAYALIGGGLGGITNGIRSFMLWHCEKSAFGSRYLWKYIVYPWLGSILALFVYALLRSGVAVLGGDITAGEVGTTQGVSMFAIGALAGYGSRDVFIWLDAQVTRLFKVSPSSEVTVPNLLGKMQKEAEAMLKGAALAVGEIVEEAQGGDVDEATLGTVITQKPVAGSLITRGQAVDITIAVAGKE